jgi:hypothetical protein
VSRPSFADVVAFDLRTGRIAWRVPVEGYRADHMAISPDGSRLAVSASTARKVHLIVFTPTDDPALDDTKGDRWFEVVDARTNTIVKRLDMSQKLEEAGYPDMSPAVRPMALAPDEKFFYFQVSFFHGFVEYDLVRDRVTRVARLPVSDEAAKLRREESATTRSGCAWETRRSARWGSANPRYARSCGPSCACACRSRRGGCVQAAR